MGARGPKAKPLEVRRRTGRSPGRDSGGRALSSSTGVTQLPGAPAVPAVPPDLRTTELAAVCFIARGRTGDKPQPCQACLAEHGAEAWLRLWAAGRKWLSVTADIDVMKRICRARIDEAHLRLVIDEDGPFTKGQRGGLVAHPAVSQLRVLNAEVVKLESLCGFTPSDRAQRGIAEVSGSGQDDIVARRTAPRVTAPVPGRAAPRPRAVGSGQD